MNLRILVMVLLGVLWCEGVGWHEFLKGRIFIMEVAKKMSESKVFCHK